MKGFFLEVLLEARILLACSRLSDCGEDAKEKGTRKVGGALSPVSTCFIFVFAFSIQRTRLSRSLEQARFLWVLIFSIGLHCLQGCL